MKTMFLFFSLFAGSAWATPALFVEETTDYSAYYTRQEAGDNLRTFTGCINQMIGTIVFEDCSAKVKVMEGDTELPPENDKDFRCHFEYQAYNPSFFKILSTSCQ